MFGNGIFYSVSDYYKKLFGCKVYKVSVDGGCTCPTRDGTKGYGGCIFCGTSGSGDFTSKKSLSITEQIQQGIKLVSDKTKDGKYIAYFQNFTNTYGDRKKLIAMYEEAALTIGVCGIAIGTRPDCIDEEILNGIAKLSERVYVSIELGFQTSNEKSVEYIRRGYENLELNRAVALIKRICPKVHVVAHIIFGLPGEELEDMISSVKYVLDAKVDGIKIALLHVLSDTDLAKDYSLGKFKCMEMTDYFRFLGEALKIIPETIVIHRLTGDGAKKYLLAPLWTGNKKVVYNSMLKYFKKNNIVQGIGYNEIIL